MSMYNDVLAFHKLFGVPIAPHPTIPPEERLEFRRKFIQEEVDELAGAMDEENFAEILDGIVDLIYVLLGMAIEYGLPVNEGWDEVHTSNMRKVGPDGKPIMSVDGQKILKPSGWVRPDLQRLINERLGTSSEAT